MECQGGGGPSVQFYYTVYGFDLKTRNFIKHTNLTKAAKLKLNISKK